MARSNNQSGPSLNNIILTAGATSRMGDLAPDGCKALVSLHGRPVIEYQLEQLGEATIVCLTKHAPLLEQYGRLVTDDSLEGPAHALLRGLHFTEGPVTVAYADTFWDEELPDFDYWCGIAFVPPSLPSRLWDVVQKGRVYTAQEPYQNSPVCIGLYRFPDAHELRRHLLLRHHDGAGLAHSVNQMELPFIEIPTWLDTGTPEALALADGLPGVKLKP